MAKKKAEKRPKSDECADEMRELLKKYRCTLDVGMVLKANAIHPTVTVIDLPAEAP